MKNNKNRMILLCLLYPLLLSNVQTLDAQHSTLSSSTHSENTLDSVNVFVRIFTVFIVGICIYVMNNFFLLFIRLA